MKTAMSAKVQIFEDVQYLGSFAVIAPDQNARAEQMKKKLDVLRANGRPKPVLIVVSLNGIKVCSPDGKEVCMAHALRRISYATCEPNHAQFSFLAREPRAHFSQQYCHAFLAKSPEQVLQLSTLSSRRLMAAFLW